jgi:hypothetical protein
MLSAGSESEKGEEGWLSFWRLVFGDIASLLWNVTSEESIGFVM